LDRVRLAVTGDNGPGLNIDGFQRGQVVLAQEEEEEPAEEVFEETRVQKDIFAGKTSVIPNGGLSILLENGRIEILPQGSEGKPVKNGRGVTFPRGNGRWLRVMGPRPEEPWNAPNG
jgi:hypothetical protein